MPRKAVRTRARFLGPAASYASLPCLGTLLALGLYSSPAQGSDEDDAHADEQETAANRTERSAEPGVFGPSVSLTSRTAYQGYQISLIAKDSEIGARDINRFAESLEGGVFGLSDGTVDVVMSLRYRTDFGTGFHRDTPNSAGIPAVDGRDDFAILFLYADWQGFDGLVSARLGRQMIVDDLAWFGLDGVKGSLHLVASGQMTIDVDAYLGSPVMFDHLFSSNALTQDGYEVDDGSGFLHAFAFGGSLRGTFVQDLSASVSYRQSVVFRGDALDAFGDAAGAAASAGTIGLEEHLLGAALGYDAHPIDMSFHGSLMWDLLLGELEQARLGASYDPAPGLHLQTEYLRSRPRFAGDSIFNFFNIFGYDRARANVEVAVLEALTLDAGYFFQKFGGGSFSDGTGFKGSNVFHGPSAGLTYRHGPLNTGLYFEASTDFGGDYAYGGNYRYGEIFGSFSFLEDQLVADARFSFTTTQSDWYAKIDLGELEDAHTSYRASAGIVAHPFEAVDIRASFVKNFDSVLEGGYYVFDEIAVRY